MAPIYHDYHIQNVRSKLRRLLLNTSIANGAGGAFAKVLLDDLQNYGTLSERTLRKIIDAAIRKTDFEKMIERLESEMGTDYLDAVKVKLPAHEIVVAIEQRRSLLNNRPESKEHAEA